jgi:prepilin-type N-terminal cleavage/methylation domain-containing protein
MAGPEDKAGDAGIHSPGLPGGYPGPVAAKANPRLGQHRNTNLRPVHETIEPFSRKLGMSGFHFRQHMSKTASKSRPADCTEPCRPRGGFTLIELMVVIGVIAMLISILLPSLARARERANQAKCASNMHEIGVLLQVYINDNKGWVFPVGPPDITGLPTTLGSQLTPDQRWPMYVKFDELKTAPFPPPYNPANYNPLVWNEAEFPSHLYTPRVMRCPSDIDPAESHSYMLNEHLAYKQIKANTTDFGNLSPSQVVVMGEKQTIVRDYYMEEDDFNRTVELYRHGIVLGSNYLYFDEHVAAVPPAEAASGMDPWDINKTVPTTAPSLPED